MAGGVFDRKFSKDFEFCTCNSIFCIYKVEKDDEPTCPKLCTNLPRPSRQVAQTDRWEKIDLQVIRNKYRHLAGCHFEAGACTFCLAKAVSKNIDNNYF